MEPIVSWAAHRFSGKNEPADSRSRYQDGRCKFELVTCVMFASSGSHRLLMRREKNGQVALKAQSKYFDVTVPEASFITFHGPQIDDSCCSCAVIPESGRDLLVLYNQQGPIILLVKASMSKSSSRQVDSVGCQLGAYIWHKQASCVMIFEAL